MMPENEREKKRKPGRPGRPRKAGERVPLGLRVTTDLKAKLDRASTESGRSQSQEAELRLEQSLNFEGALFDALDLAYGRELTALVLALARALHTAGTRAAFVSEFTEEGINNWMLNPYAFDQAARAANVVLEALRPEGDAGVPQGTEPSFGVPQGSFEMLGEGFAYNVLEAITKSPEAGEREEWARLIAERLATSGVQFRFEQEVTAGDPEKER